MLRRIPLFVLLVLLATGGCRQDPVATSNDQTTTAAESVTAPPPPPAVREILDDVEPSIPLWPGARASDDSVREQGTSTIIDLWTNDSFPMVWHYYVTYFAQYRAWEPLDPYPDPSDEGRQLQLDLSEIMQDPFVPGTELEPGDRHVTLMIREDPTRNRVNIRYVLQPPRPASLRANDESRATSEQ